MTMVFSGIMIPVSTIDWYGRSVSVVFFNGCNFNCIYCSNKNFIDVTDRLEPLFKKGKVVDIEEIEKQILDAKTFISAVVFSGGEPTMHPRELERLAGFAREQGLLVGIETNGFYPERLEELIKKKLLDRIFLDIKAPPENTKKYKTITGGIGDAAEKAIFTLNLNDVDIEVRTTVFPSFAADVTEIAKSIAGRNCTYVIQQGIPEYAPDKNIRKEKPLTRDELAAIAGSLTFMKDVRIRTREKGEERII
ncbi:MAG: anaerobic ribonucleoside-triphosphate reductase activating protein [Euryarchaeota archaeon]|nr:anaerobic ribonucleoside-triphosphate reductase activating protein [Euryarchaeota archaeon]MCG2736897.1 anaerobic ribonucleoside-triphosphate reductase activating protein [Candidatus Methanoperedenaceae archaeon]